MYISIQIKTGPPYTDKLLSRENIKLFFFQVKSRKCYFYFSSRSTNVFFNRKKNPFPVSSPFASIYSGDFYTVALLYRRKIRENCLAWASICPLCWQCHFTRCRNDLVGQYLLPLVKVSLGWEAVTITVNSVRFLKHKARISWMKDGLRSLFQLLWFTWTSEGEFLTE